MIILRQKNGSTVNNPYESKLRYNGYWINNQHNLDEAAKEKDVAKTAINAIDSVVIQKTGKSMMANAVDNIIKK